MKHVRKSIILSGLLAVIMSLVLILAPIGGSTRDVYGSAPVHVTIDGQLIHFPDQRPVMVNNRVMVPVRGVFEHLGFEIYWDYQNRMARLAHNDVLIIIPADLNSFVVNSEIVTPSVPQQMINNRLMLPLRYIAEAANATAQWNAEGRVAMITTSQSQATPTPTPSPSPPPVHSPSPEPTPSPTPPPDDEPYDPEPSPEPTPSPEPEPTPPPSPTQVWYYHPLTQTPRHNITRTNTNVQGQSLQGILTRAHGANENRDSDSWIEFDLSGIEIEYTRFTGRVGRTGAAITVPDAAPRVATIYGDGHVLAQFTVDGYFQVQSFDVDISGVNTIRIHFQAIGPANENGVSLTMFDLYLR
ncbi:MAG: stalk domain-containing protein [Defluviitaleaceae bacterium]|nr:stalk domain-containing protein [Defluviitaleaceae bacterium]